MSINLRKGRHCVFQLHVHLVFVTKYRKSVFSKPILDSLKSIFAKVCNDFEAELIEVNGEEDHVHLLVNYPPKVLLTKLVNSLKGVSSRKIKHIYPDMIPHYLNGALWSPSYFAASCGGAPLQIIRQYIQNQAEPKT